MSFMLGIQRNQVAFDVRSGELVEFNLAPYSCLLDVRTNMYFRIDHALIQNMFDGNFSSWVNVGPTEGIAVSGMTSCGGILVANHNFSRMAAGHMSGDVQFVLDWCTRLGSSDSGPPHYLIWATGPDSSGARQGRELLRYMEQFGITPNRAPAVALCSEIVLSGDGKVHAGYGGRGIVSLMTG